MDPLIGRVLLDRYEVLERIGSGGMGAVFVARQAAVGRKVALKVLRTDLMTNEQVRERFRREAEIIARLRHPNTVQLYDFGETADGLSVMVMELLVGQALNECLRERGTLGIEETLRVGEQVASSLHEAHQLGLVHRDLKPANIFLVDVAGQIYAKVLDFGIARIMDEEATRLTSTGQVFGTPRYMSPEQALSTGDVDARSDIYSLGLILYECLVGQPPFVAQTSVQYLSAHTSAPPPKLRERKPEAPRVLEDLIDACLEKAPEARPPDCDAVAKTLSAVRRAFEHGDRDPQIALPSLILSASADLALSGAGLDAGTAPDMDAFGVAATALPGRSAAGAAAGGGVGPSSSTRSATLFPSQGEGANRKARSISPWLLLSVGALFVVGVAGAMYAVRTRSGSGLGGDGIGVLALSGSEDSKADASDLSAHAQGGFDASGVHGVRALQGDGGDASRADQALGADAEGLGASNTAETDGAAGRARDASGMGDGEAADAGPGDDDAATLDAGRRRSTTRRRPRSRKATERAPFGADALEGPRGMVINIGDEHEDLRNLATRCERSVLRGLSKLSTDGCPPGCAILVDQLCGGRTPANEIDVAPGRKTVAIVCDRKIVRKVRVQFSEGKLRKVRCK
ncbi:MAG: serine/threonine protein kinase [Deltaproteobacteria bacterium]|nr:serine/threonine protein kinase [Deltaproteobacteria bacterium]